MSDIRTVLAAAVMIGLPAQSGAVGPAPAQEPVQPVLVQLQVDDSGAARINLSGRLRMLSQRIVSSACHAAAGIVPEMSAPMLLIASNEFDRILAALRYPDPKLSVLSAETDPKVKAQIAAVRAVWDPMHAQILDTVGKPISIELAAELADQASSLLEETKMLFNRESAEYGSEALQLQPDALLVDMAGRQRMFAQQISKNACLAAEGDDTVLAELGANIDFYDTSLNALRNGMAEVGILPPPTQEISDILDEAIVEWTAMQPILARIMDGETPTEAEREVIFIGGYSLSAKMNFLAWKYQQNVKSRS